MNVFAEALLAHGQVIDEEDPEDDDCDEELESVQVEAPAVEVSKGVDVRGCEWDAWATAIRNRDRERAGIATTKAAGGAPPGKGDASLHALQGARLHTLPMRARIQGRGY